MKKTAGLFILVFFLLITSYAGLKTGPTKFTLNDIFSVDRNAAEQDSPARIVFFGIRLPRILLSMLVGFSLGIAGAAFQGLFRNPLADPYIIGASSGASLGATIAIIFAGSLFGFAGTAFSAFSGALLTVTAVFLFSCTGERNPPVISLLLAGTAVSSLLSACVTFLMIWKSSDIQRIFYWLLGSFSTASWIDVTGLLIVLIPGFAGLYACAPGLDLLSFGEESAVSGGVPVQTIRIITLVSATLITAAAVSVSGIIGFVGLIAPHICRLAFGPSHRFLLPVSGLAGAVLLVSADTLSRTVLYPVELPAGIITAFLGAPFFLYLLKKEGGRLR